MSENHIAPGATGEPQNAAAVPDAADEPRDTSAAPRAAGGLPNERAHLAGVGQSTLLSTFTPLLTTRDWSEEWKQLQKARRKADDPSFWDMRAHTFPADAKPSEYAGRFLELAGIRPGETVFDMGCGTGALSLPLGLAGHAVLACDFSQGMLTRMQEVLDEAGVDTVTTRQLSWDDSRDAWAAAGAGPGSADVALASRSIATADLRDSLLRLSDVARRRVCITLTTGSSPRTDEHIMAAIGLEDALCRDYLYAVNILAAEGLRPQLSYIDSARYDTFTDFDDAFDNLSRMVADATAATGSDVRDAALGRLREWLDANLVPNEHAGEPNRRGLPQLPLRLREPRVISWAFIAWDK